MQSLCSLLDFACAVVIEWVWIPNPASSLDLRKMSRLAGVRAWTWRPRFWRVIDFWLLCSLMFHFPNKHEKPAMCNSH